MEVEAHEFMRVEKIFNECLLCVPDVELWSYYLDYIRRMNNVTTGGQAARATVSQAFDFVLLHVGFDLAAGRLWHDYLRFIRSAPATSTWEEQQRNDQLRRVYQRAVVTPLQNVEQLWREYDAFENGISRQTARKFLSESSPGYMTARACARELAKLTDVLRSGPGARDLPKRPSRTAAEDARLDAWRRWIAWERGDPLGLDKADAVQRRVKFALKRCLAHCRFFPEVWYEAADYHDSIGQDPAATYRQAAAANPRSWLLGFALAEAEELAKRPQQVKDVYDRLLGENGKARARIEAQVRELHDAPAAEQADVEVEVDAASSEDAEAEPIATDDAPAEAHDDEAGTNGNGSDDEDTVRVRAAPPVAEDEKRRQLKALEAELDALGGDATTAYIMYMRAMRRLEGVKAARAVFARAVKSPRHTWQLYVASAMMEHQCSKDSAIAVRIFRMGMKQFDRVEPFVLAFLDFLIAVKDDANARALFEQAAPKLEQSRQLCAVFYAYEAMYGDLVAARKLAARMDELFDDGSPLSSFGARHSFQGLDPIATRDLGLNDRPTVELGVVVPPPFGAVFGDGQMPPMVPPPGWIPPPPPGWVPPQDFVPPPPPGWVPPAALLSQSASTPQSQAQPQAQRQSPAPASTTAPAQGQPEQTATAQPPIAPAEKASDPVDALIERLGFTPPPAVLALLRQLPAADVGTHAAEALARLDAASVARLIAGVELDRPQQEQQGTASAAQQEGTPGPAPQPAAAAAVVAKRASTRRSASREPSATPNGGAQSDVTPAATAAATAPTTGAATTAMTGTKRKANANANANAAAAAAAAAASMPEDLIPLGRHNDPRDPYKKRNTGA